MTWRAGLVVASLVVAGCTGPARLGTGYPACDLEFDEVGTATIVQAQAVPEAAYGPCVSELDPGWDLRIIEPERGRAGFVLDSDRVGFGFVTVSLVDACDAPPSVTSQTRLSDGVVREIVEDTTVEPLPVTLVPVAPRHGEAAFAVGNDLVARRVDGHRLSVRTDDRRLDPATRITEALAAGRSVLVVDDYTLTDDVFELRFPDDPGRVEVDDLDELVDDLADAAPAPTYRATWWHRFDGGCVEFAFDATGPGAESVAGQVDRAVGLYPLGDLRRYAATQDLVYGDPPG